MNKRKIWLSAVVLLLVSCLGAATLIVFSPKSPHADPQVADGDLMPVPTADPASLPSTLPPEKSTAGPAVESFEAASLSATWSTENGGAIELSHTHYKDGNSSLHWTWSDNSGLLDTQPAYLAEANVKNGGMKLWIYNENPIQDHATFDFGKADEINRGISHYTFNVNLNFTGWRAIWIKFREEGKNPAYKENLNNPLEVMQIVPPASVSSGSLYFDNLEFPTSMVYRRSADDQMPKPDLDVGGGTWDNVYYYSQQQPTIPLESTVTQPQIEAFKAVASKYEKWIYGDSLQYASLGGPLKQRYDALQKFIKRGVSEYDSLHIVRHPDGTITGKALYAHFDPMSPKFGDDVSERILLPLVFDYKINGHAASKQKFIDVLDYMHDQGWAAGSALGTQDHEVNLHNGYFHSVYLMRNELKEAGRLDRELQTMFWFSNFGKTFDNSVNVETTSDEMRTKFIYDLLYVLCLDNTPKKVQYMQGLNEMYEQALQIAPGYADVIKPDGTLFHHRGAYLNDYGPPAIETAALVAYFLSGTPWHLSDNAFDNIKKALHTLDLVSNPYTMSVGATGRFPAQTNLLTHVQAYAYLAMAKNPIDPELASAFMRLWNPQSKVLQATFSRADSYGVQYVNTLGGLQLAINLSKAGFAPQANPQGVRVLPYAATAVNRVNDILVGIKGWSRYVWDFEGGSTKGKKENVYGRYQSYGNMQILSNGLTSGNVESGVNVNAGWDWSRWPGSTVKHLSLPELAYDADTDPMRSFSDSTFVGGVSSENNKYGLFAMTLRDSTDPSFRANKSVFFFGDKMVSLGSDIQNSDSRHDTETILFQSYMPSGSMPFWLNSTTPIADPTYTNTLTSETAAWIVDPYGNGYVLPNASGTVITRGVQKSRDGWDKKDTSGNYTTAYINHGTSPSSAGYEYAIKVNAGAQGTEDFASQPQYTVLKKDSNAHIVQNTEPGKEVTGYAIFNSSAPVNQGLIQSSSAPIMAMVQPLGTGEVELSVADPDLRLSQYAKIEMPDDILLQPSEMKKVTVTLSGKWQWKQGSDGIRVAASSEKSTTVEFDAVDGKTFNVILKPSGNE